MKAMECTSNDMDCSTPTVSEVDALLRDLSLVPGESSIWRMLSSLADSCLPPPLSSPYDELAFPQQEYNRDTQIYHSRLEELEKMLLLLDEKEMKQPLNPEFASSIVLLCEHITARGPWAVIYNTPSARCIVQWSQKNSSVYGSNKTYRGILFEICMRKFHLSLTKDKWKHYPALMECYRTFIGKMTESSKIRCPLHVAFPATLMQLDDYHIENKVKGLKCCTVLLSNLDFTKTGYEDVVYDTLAKLLLFKETPILQDLLNCTLLIVPLYRDEDQWSKCDNIFEVILDSLYMESDAVRRNVYLKSLPLFFESLGNCVIRWKKRILSILCDGIDIYLNHPQDHDGVNNCVKCLLKWIEIGWPVWSYSSDNPVLVKLFKLLYISSVDENIANQIDVEEVEKCIIIILSLYTDTQRHEVFDECDTIVTNLCGKFIQIWKSVKEILSNSNKSDCMAKE